VTPLTEGARVVACVVGDVDAMDLGWVYIRTSSGHVVAVPAYPAGVRITVIPAGPPGNAELDRLWEMVREDPAMTSTGRMTDWAGEPVWSPGVDQGPAGVPDRGSGEGGIAATTRALPAGPSYRVGDPDPSGAGGDRPRDGVCRAQHPATGPGWSGSWICTWSPGHEGEHVAGDGLTVLAVWPQIGEASSFVGAFAARREAGEWTGPDRVEWTGADEGEWLRRMDDYGIDTASARFGGPPESTCPGHSVPAAATAYYCDGSCVDTFPLPHNLPGLPANWPTTGGA
jgi:hypothetical protein